MRENLGREERNQTVEAEVRQVLLRLKLNGESAGKLFGEIEIVEAVVSELNNLSEQPSPKPGDLAYRVISRKIYEGCASLDEDVQNTAYQWLGGYLYRYIFPNVKHNPTLAEDLSNGSLEKVFKKLTTCRMPEAFLSWAGQIAVREVLQFRRAENKTVQADEEISPTLARAGRVLEFDSESLEIARLSAPTETEPENIIISQEKLRLLIERIEQLKPTKRSGYYKQILYGTYFLGLTDLELANRYQLTLQKVQKMRFQALAYLRRDQEWFRNLAE
jgi:DNA-directed RNA polymerase specialized sigma24 family protein